MRSTSAYICFRREKVHTARIVSIYISIREFSEALIVCLERFVGKSSGQRRLKRAIFRNLF